MQVLRSSLQKALDISFVSSEVNAPFDLHNEIFRLMLPFLVIQTSETSYVTECWYAAPFVTRPRYRGYRYSAYRAESHAFVDYYAMPSRTRIIADTGFTLRIPTDYLSDTTAECNQFYWSKTFGTPIPENLFPLTVVSWAPLNSHEWEEPNPYAYGLFRSIWEAVSQLYLCLNIEDISPGERPATVFSAVFSSHAQILEKSEYLDKQWLTFWQYCKDNCQALMVDGPLFNVVPPMNA